MSTKKNPLMPQEKQIYGALTVYRETGRYLRKREQFVKSKAAYDLAYKSNPEDVRLLIGRSQVCTDSVQPNQAIEDAKRALEIEPQNMEAKNVEAQAFYILSEFERSIVMNHRGAKVRKRPPYFTEGIIQGLETMENCIGDKAGNVLVDYLPIIARHATIEHQDEPQEKVHISRIPLKEEKSKITYIEAKKHELLTRVLAMKYLGPMARDKFFLKELMTDERIPSANKKGCEKLKELIEQALNTLNERQEMLRSQQPYYTIRLGEKSESKHLNKYMKERLYNECRSNTRNAEYKMKLILKSYSKGRINEMMKHARKMQAFLDNKTHHNLPDINGFTDRLYKLVGDGYLSLYRISFKLSDQSNRRRVGFLMGFPVERPKSHDSVVLAYPDSFIITENIIAKTTAELEISDNKYQRLWLAYELARLHNKRKNYPKAKFYAKQCQREAEAADCPTWWLNGCLTLLSGEMQQGNINEVKMQIEQALRWAKETQDSLRLITFLTHCDALANDIVVGDENKAEGNRQKEILSLMDEDMRAKTQVLFGRIATLPPGRQFLVMPSRREPASDASVRTAYYQPRLTVVPGATKSLRPLPATKVPGYQVFDF